MFQVSVGKAALSTFRLEKLRAALNDVAPGVTLADTRHWYFSALRAAELSKAQAGRLGKVLGLNKSAGEPKQADTLQRVLVVPRLGTISPWSSKATDILKNCGLTGFRRIERGVAFHALDATGRPLPVASSA